MTSTVYIAKTVYGGDGLGRLGDGRVVFVPGAFAGESVKAEIILEKKNFVKARLVEISEASPDRTGEGEPPIPGMVYANLSYAAECDAKESQLAEALDRAHIVHPGIRAADNASFPQLAYRNKAVYHFAMVGKHPRQRLVMGYRAEPSHEIADISEDPLARPEISAKLPEIRSRVESLLANGAAAVRKSVEKEGNVTVRWSRLSGVQWWIGSSKNPVVMKETTCGKTFEVPSDGFYQVNPVVGEALAKYVCEVFAADPTDDILDLYCGVGVFGILCATKARQVRLTGIESGRQAVEFARRNAAAHGFTSARFFSEEVGRSLRKLRIGDRTTVIVDPPRGGLERNTAEFLSAAKAPRVIYVSCDPATLARDLRELSRGYEVESVRWFNMFPRTARFETAVVLRKKGLAH